MASGHAKLRRVRPFAMLFDIVNKKKNPKSATFLFCHSSANMWISEPTGKQ